MSEDFNQLRDAVISLLVSPKDVADFEEFNELRTWLIENIEWLIDHDLERMMGILYRIDVSEQKVRKLIAENEGENAAEIMADLILTREAQKVESRKKFKESKGDQSFDDQAETWN